MGNKQLTRGRIAPKRAIPYNNHSYETQILHSTYKLNTFIIHSEYTDYTVQTLPRDITARQN